MTGLQNYLEPIRNRIRIAVNDTDRATAATLLIEKAAQMAVKDDLSEGQFIQQCEAAFCTAKGRP